MSNLSQNDPMALTATLPDVAEDPRPLGGLAPETPDERRLVFSLARDIDVVERRSLAGVMKRAADVLLAGGALFALAPMLIVAALAVRFTSQGPILFAQTRVGRGGRLFRFYKFRSMVVNAEELKAELAAQNEHAGPIFKMKRDPRITRVGRFLRKYSVDELPQLLNVIRGDMSIVGPRPPVPSEVVKYESWQLRRLSVTPGLTCIWQTSGRSRVTFEEWMRMDLEYIDTWSLGLDAKLVLKTFRTVLLADGAY